MFNFLAMNFLFIAKWTEDIRQGIINLLYKLALLLDSAVYGLINSSYKIFLALSQDEFLDSDSAAHLIRRVYELLGVVMLFVLSYMLLRMVIDPDKKESKSSGKIVLNAAKAIVLLALVPFIFSTAFKVQNAILKQNTIGKVILGTDDSSDTLLGDNLEQTINEGGVDMALSVYEAFFFFNDQKEAICKDKDDADLSYEEIMALVKQDGSFKPFIKCSSALADEEKSDKLEYMPILSLIAGGMVAWFMISYCLSLGFRVVKLAFYEIMAPVCIIGSILPSKKDLLSNWIKATLTTFLEVFIRIGVMYFAVYLLTLLRDRKVQIFSNIGLDSGPLKALAFAMIVMGIVRFIKSAPDLISKLTGIDSGTMSLGIKDQLAQGGAFMAGAAAGGLVSSAVRNGAAGWRNVRNAYKEGGFKKAARTAAKLPGSIIAGGLSGGIRAGRAAKDAKGWGDMKKAASSGTTDAMKARADRADRKSRYQASYGKSPATGGNWVTRTAKNLANKAAVPVLGRVGDAKDSISDWATGGASQYEAEIAAGKKYGDKKSKIDSQTAKLRDKYGNEKALVNQNLGGTGENGAIQEYSYDDKTGRLIGAVLKGGELISIKDGKIDKALDKAGNEITGAALETLSKQLSSSVGKWKGSADAQVNLAAEFNKLQGLYGGSVSLNQVTEYLNQLSTNGVDRGNYKTDDDYNRAVIAHNTEVEILKNMKTQLEKQADAILIDASLTAKDENGMFTGAKGADGKPTGKILIDGVLTSISADDMSDTNAAVTDFMETFKLDGASVKDKVNGKSQDTAIEVKEKDNAGNPIATSSPSEQAVSQQIKLVSDAYGHNAGQASASASRYEERKAQREGEKK